MFDVLKAKKFTPLWYSNATQAYVCCTIRLNLPSSHSPHEMPTLVA